MDQEGCFITVAHPQQQKVISKEQGQNLANELGIRFMETSAKANIGVEGAFFDLAR